MLSNQIHIDDKGLFTSYIRSFCFGISDLNFTSLFMWQQPYSLRYEIIHDFLCISGVYEEEPFIFPPLFKDRFCLSHFAMTLEVLKRRFHEAGHSLKIKFVPSLMLKLFQRIYPRGFVFVPDRDNFDYVYLTRDLIQLGGRKLHAKKNHLNYFLKTTAYQYESLTKAYIDPCMDLTRRLIEGDHSDHERSLLQNEEAAIEKALYHMEKLDYVGGVILVDGKLEAFTFGEKLQQNMMVIHIEKANANIRGLYQAINQQFAFHECSHLQFINREEDMGLPSLRRAKESYQPIKLMEKYDVILT